MRRLPAPTLPNCDAKCDRIWKRLEPALKGERARLKNVRLFETEDLYVDYTGASLGAGQ